MRILYKLFFCCVVMMRSCFAVDAPAVSGQTQQAQAVQPSAGAATLPAAPVSVEAAPAVPPTPAQPQAQPVMPPAPSAQSSAQAQIVAMPSAPTPQAAQSAPATSDDEITGIDTADLSEPQGNWLFKRMWWQRAESQYEKIKALVETIMESRLAFFAKRTEWDKTIFDPFYLEIGVGRGVLEELISSVIAQMNDERAKAGVLSQEERELLAAFETEKSALEQLRDDVQKINTIDSAIDDAITALINQINAARNFEKQSWQNFKNIAQELSDKNARDLYYGMATYWQNINDIADYIQNPFLNYFEALGSSAKDQIAKVNDSLKALKEKGIDFKKHWQNLQEQHQREHDAQEYHQGLGEGEKEAQHKKEAQEKTEVGFVDRVIKTIGDTITSVVGFISSGVKSAWDFTIGRFFQKSAPKEQSAQAPAVQPNKE